jgi:hypothetical protein
MMVLYFRFCVMTGPNRQVLPIGEPGDEKRDSM